MKNTKRIAALLLVGMLAFSLTGCSIKSVARSAVIAIFGDPNEDSGEETTDIYATAGGSVTFPTAEEVGGAYTLDPAKHFSTMAYNNSLWVMFSGITNRSTPYFKPTGDTITITGYATTESTGLLEYKAALWELSDDQTTTTYVAGSTVYYTTGGDCYTQSIGGLDPNKLYKVTISYDSGKFFITGGMQIEGVGGDLTTVEGEEDQG